MVTRPRTYGPTVRDRVTSPRRFHLYILEWMRERGVSDSDLAKLVGVERVTVTRWRTQQHRLDPAKIERIAKALNVEPAALWRPPNPNRPSIDSMLKDASDELVQQVAKVADIMKKTGT